MISEMLVKRSGNIQVVRFGVKVQYIIQCYQLKLTRKTTILLQRSSNFDQTWFWWSLGQCTSEKCWECGAVIWWSLRDSFFFFSIPFRINVYQFVNTFNITINHTWNIHFVTKWMFQCMIYCYIGNNISPSCTACIVNWPQNIFILTIKNYVYHRKFIRK